MNHFLKNKLLFFHFSNVIEVNGMRSFNAILFFTSFFCFFYTILISFNIISNPVMFSTAKVDAIKDDIGEAKHSVTGQNKNTNCLVIEASSWLILVRATGVGKVLNLVPFT